MKKLLLTSGILLSLLGQAQMKEGKIIYERTAQMPSRVFANLDPEIAARIPKSSTDQYELMFANGQSLYQTLPSTNSEEGGNSFRTADGGGMVVRMNIGNNDIAYYNFEKSYKVDQRELMDRNYVIRDSLQAGNWKLTDETKTVLKYAVRKAIGKRVITRMQTSMENGELKREFIPDTAEVIAWFTSEIPVPVGPELQGQLPGAILEMDINKGQIVYNAVEVSAKVNASKIKEPNEGKKLTAAEFAIEREKLMEEMRKNMPEGRTIRINQ
jgi:GLPGLI family protein